jgi:hypothetical protein
MRSAALVRRSSAASIRAVPLVRRSPEYPFVIPHPELHPDEAAEAEAARLAAEAALLAAHEDELHPLADTPSRIA